MTDVIKLADRIILDNTCVIEGNYDELQEAEISDNIDDAYAEVLQL